MNGRGRLYLQIVEIQKGLSLSCLISNDADLQIVEIQKGLSLYFNDNGQAQDLQIVEIQKGLSPDAQELDNTISTNSRNSKRS